MLCPILEHGVLKRTRKRKCEPPWMRTFFYNRIKVEKCLRWRLPTRKKDYSSQVVWHMVVKHPYGARGNILC